MFVESGEVVSTGPVELAQALATESARKSGAPQSTVRRQFSLGAFVMPSTPFERDSSTYSNIRGLRKPGQGWRSLSGLDAHPRLPR